MNKLQRFLALLFRPLFNRIPDPKTIDRTGIVKSDHPKPGNGWIKGWLVDTPSRSIIIVARHANPTLSGPSSVVFFTDAQGRKHSRQIVQIDRAPFKVRAGKPTDSDIAICRLDEPLPKGIKAYKIATRLDNLAEKVVTYDQFDQPSVAQIRFYDGAAWITGRNRKGNQLQSGDSGLPWFVRENDEWRVLTHTTMDLGGEGPWYAHPFIYRDLISRIKDLETP